MKLIQVYLAGNNAGIEALYNCTSDLTEEEIENVITEANNLYDEDEEECNIMLKNAGLERVFIEQEIYI
jgi:hypothetical protein